VVGICPHKQEEASSRYPKFFPLEDLLNCDVKMDAFFEELAKAGVSYIYVDRKHSLARGG